MPTGDRPQPPDFTMRLAFNNIVGGARWSNVLWAQAETVDTPSVAALNAFATDASQKYAQAILVPLSEDCAHDGCVVTFFGAGSDAIDGDGSFPATGGESAAATAAQVAACISWPIAAHYRGGHPRSYVGGLPVTALGTTTQLDATFRAALADAAISFRNDFNDLELDGHAVHLGVVSFVDGGDWRSPPIFRSYADGATVDARIDTQRRRLGRAPA